MEPIDFYGDAKKVFEKDREREVYNQALEDLVKLMCEYYTMQERAGYCADTNNMIKRRIAEFAELLKR